MPRRDLRHADARSSGRAPSSTRGRKEWGRHGTRSSTARSVHVAPDSGRRPSSPWFERSRRWDAPYQTTVMVVLMERPDPANRALARHHFGPFEPARSRATSSGAGVERQRTDQAATPAAFEALRFVAGRRLRRGAATRSSDATKRAGRCRRSLGSLAREHDVLPVAVRARVPQSVWLCRKENAAGTTRDFGCLVVKRQ